MVRKLVTKEFQTVKELRDILDEWLTTPGAISKEASVGYVESGQGEVFAHAHLLSERLSDGSYVYGVRLS